MSHWNYRLCVEATADGLGGLKDVWTIRAVYYDSRGKPNGFSAVPMHPEGSTYIECADDLCKMSEGLSGPCYRIDGGKLRVMERGERFKEAQR